MFTFTAAKSTKWLSKTSSHWWLPYPCSLLRTDRPTRTTHATCKVGTMAQQIPRPQIVKLMGKFAARIMLAPRNFRVWCVVVRSHVKMMEDRIQQRRTLATQTTFSTTVTVPAQNLATTKPAQKNKSVALEIRAQAQPFHV